MTRAWLPRLFLAVFCLLACDGKHRDASGSKGGGADGNPNFLQGVLISPENSMPLPAMTIILSKRSTAPHSPDSAWVPIDTVFTDSTGAFLFRLIDLSEVKVNAYLGDSLIFSSQFFYDPAEGYNLGVQEAASLGPSPLLLENFEDADRPSALSAWISDADPWRVDPLYSAIVTTPATILDSVQSAGTDCGEQGRCLHFSIDSHGTRDSTLLLKNRLRLRDECAFLMSESDSFSVLAKGRGMLQLGYDSQDDDYPGIMSGNDAPYSLTSSWKRYSIPLRWPEMQIGDETIFLKRLCYVHVGLVGVGELWVDDLYFPGVSPYALTQ